MKYQICVSGAASGETVDSAHEKAFAIGAEIARSGKTLLTGATVGLPHFAARGFKSVGQTKGVSVGFSPASSFREHISTYRCRLPNSTISTSPVWNMLAAMFIWCAVPMR